MLYFMLFGEYIKVQRVTDPALSQTTYRLKTPLKRYWACDLWEDLFCTLLNQSGCSKPPPWDSLHAKFQDHWATNPTTAKTLLTDLRKQVAVPHQSNLRFRELLARWSCS